MIPFSDRWYNGGSWEPKEIRHILSSSIEGINIQNVRSNPPRDFNARCSGEKTRSPRKLFSHTNRCSQNFILELEPTTVLDIHKKSNWSIF